MTKVLVTGATGFIGRQLVKMLTKDYQVRVLVRDLERATQLPSAVEVWQGDLTQPHTLRGCCEGIGCVYHLAGFAHAFADDAAAFSKQHLVVNFHGTEHLLREAIAAGTKGFIYFSSSKAGSSTPYGVAKLKAEELLLHEGRSHDLHVSILRPCLVYGPHCKGNLASMLRAIDKGRFVPLPETRNRRSMVSIDDLCKAAMLAANSPSANGKVYYVTDGKDYSTRELYEAIATALGKRVPRWSVPLKVFKMLAKAGDIATFMLRRRMPFNSDVLDKLFSSAQYDSSPIQKDLNFRASTDLQAMLPDIISAYKEYAS